MPEFRVSEISGTQGWIGPWVPALGLTPSAGMTMRRWSLRFDQVGICSKQEASTGGCLPPGAPNDGGSQPSPRHHRIAQHARLHFGVAQTMLDEVPDADN